MHYNSKAIKEFKEVFNDMKRTYQPKKRSRLKVHGFRARMRSNGGQNVLARRRKKGRKNIAAAPLGSNK